MRRGRPRHDDILTPREWEVLDLLREDLTNEQIANRLGVSLNTVKYHLSEIYSKLGVESRREAAVWRGAPRGVLGVAPLLALLLKLKAVSPLKAAGVGAIGAAGVAFVALILGVVLGQSSPIEPSLGKIAFVMDGDVWVKDLPDGAPQRVSDAGGFTMPQWSPSGEWLSVMRNEAPQGSRAYVMRADGSQARQVDGLVAYWSPTEDLIAYMDDGVLLVERADGSGRRGLLEPIDMRSGVVMRPSQESTYWSPNGEWLTYVELWRELPGGTPIASELHSALHRVRLDDAQVEELYRPTSDEALLPGGWTGDGGFLLVLTWSSATTSVYSHPLMVTSLAGPRPESHATDLEVFPIAPATVAPGPDGRTFALVEGPDSGWASKRIALFDPATGETTPLTSPDLAAVGPAWSPDGSRIAYVAATAAPADLNQEQAREAMKERRLWLMDADGSNQRRLTNDPRYRDESPRWSADGRYILFGRVDLDAVVPLTSLWLFDTESNSLSEILSGLDLWESYGFHWLWAQQADWWQPR